MRRYLLLLFAVLFAAIGAFGQDTNVTAAEGVTAKIGDTDVSNVLKDVGAQPNAYDATTGLMEIVVDLTESKEIDGFSITFSGDRWVSEFKLSYSTDGTNYTDIDTYQTGINSTTTTTIQKDFTSAINARYIKYTSDKKNNSNNGDYSETIKNFRLLKYADTSAAPPTHTDIYYDIYTVNFSTPVWQLNWNGSATDAGETYYRGVPVKSLNSVGAVHFGRTGEQQDFTTDALTYGNLSVDIYVESATNDYCFNFNNGGYTQDIQLNAGWNTVTANVTNDNASNLKILSIRCKDSGTKTNLKLANIYFTKAAEDENTNKIVSLSVTPQIVVQGKATDLTFVAKNNRGGTIDNTNVTYSGTGLSGTSLTATTETVTITGSTNSGAESATTTVYAITAPTRTNKTGDLELLQSGKTGYDQASTGYDGGFTHLDDLVYSDNTKAFHASKVKKFYMTNPNLSADDVKGYDFFHLDIFSTVGKSGVVVNLEGINKQTTVNVEAGKWTSVDIDLTDANAASSWIWIKFCEPNESSDAEIVVDNIYFGKKVEAKTITNFTIGGAATATGTTTEALALAVTDNDGTAVDFDNLTFTVNDGTNNITTGFTLDATAKTIKFDAAGTYTITVKVKDGVTAYKDEAEAGKTVTATITAANTPMAITSLEVTTTATDIKVGDNVEMNVTVKAGGDAITNYDGLTITGKTGETEVTLTYADSKWTFTPTAAGDYTFYVTSANAENYTVGSDVKTSTTITVAAATPSTSTIPSPTQTVFAAIYTKDVASKVTWGVVYDGGATVGTQVTDESGNVATPFTAATGKTGAKKVFFTNTDIAGDIYNVNINPTAKRYAKLYLHVYSETAGTGVVSLEQTKKIANSHAFSVTAGQWTEVEIDLTGETFIKAMSVIMDATGGQDFSLANIYFTEAQITEDAKKVASMKLGTQLVAKNVATDLGIVVMNSDGTSLDDIQADPKLYTLSADKGTFGTDGKFTTTEDGPITITATSTVDANLKATATLNTYPEGPQAPTIDAQFVVPVYSSYYDKTTNYALGDATWDKGHKDLGTYNYAEGKNALVSGNVGTFYLQNTGDGAVSIDGCDKVRASVYVAEATAAKFGVENNQQDVSLVAGWNYLVATYTPANDAKTAVYVRVDIESKDKTLIIDDVYFTKPIQELTTLTVEPTTAYTNEQKELTLTTKNGETTVEDVTYKVTNANNEDVTNTVLTVTGGKYTFKASAAGTYTITASKTGYIGTPTATITVKDPVTITSLAVTTAENAPIAKSEATELTFTVKDGKDETVSNDAVDFIITTTENGTENADVEINEGKYTFKKSGTYYIYANAKTGNANITGSASTTVSVKVKVKGLTVSPTMAVVNTDTPLTLAVTDLDNEAIANEKLTFAIDGDNASLATLTNGTFKATATGTYTIKATANDDAYTGSATATITVTDAPAVEIKTLEVSKATAIVNETTDLTFTVKDAEGNTLTENLTYSIKEGSVAATIDADGKNFKPTETGTVTIVVKPADGITTLVGSAEVVITVTETPVNIPAIADADDVKTAIYVNTANGLTDDAVWQVGWNGGASDGKQVTGNDSKFAMYFANTKNVAFGPKAHGNAANTAFNPTSSEYGKLKLKVYSPDVTDSEVTGYVRLEGAGDKEYTAFTLKKDQWTDVEIDLDGITNIACMHICSYNQGGADGAQAINLYVTNAYFTKAAENPDKDFVSAITLTTSYVAKNTATDLGVKVVNNKGVELTSDKYTLTASKGSFDADGKFTTTEDGPITITATSVAEKDGSKPEATATVNTYPDADTAPTAAAADVLAVYSDKYGATTYTPSDAGWNGGFGTQTEVELATGDKAIAVSNAVCFGLNAGEKDITDYTYLNVSIYSSIDFTGKIDFEGTEMRGDNVLPITLKANQWNDLKLELTGTRTAATWIQMYVGSADSKNSIFVDNVYFSKEAVPAKVVKTFTVDGKESTSGYTDATYTLAVKDDSGNDVDFTKLTFTVNNGTSDIATGFTLDKDKKTIKFDAAGTYTITVKVAEGNTDYQDETAAGKTVTIKTEVTPTTFTLKSITPSEATVKVGETVAISVQDGSDNDITTNENLTFAVTKDGVAVALADYYNAETKTFTAKAAGAYSVVVTPKEGQTTVTGDAQTSKITVEKLAIKDLTVTVDGTIETGKQLTIGLTDEKDKEIEANRSDIAYSYTKDGGEAQVLTGNTFTPAETGVYVFTAKATDASEVYTGSATSEEITVTKAIAVPAVNADDVFAPIYSNGNTADNDKAVFTLDYNGGATQGAEYTDANGNVAMPFTAKKGEETYTDGIGCVFFWNTALMTGEENWKVNNIVPADRGYDALHLDIYADKDNEAGIVMEGTNYEASPYPVTLKKNEWVTVNLPMSEVTGTINNMSLRAAAPGVNVYLANIYFTKAEVKEATIGSVEVDKTAITTIGSATVTVKDNAETPADILQANLTLTVQKKGANGYEDTDDATVASGKFTATKAGTYRITASPKEGVTEITGSANSADITVTAAEIGKLTVSPATVSKGVETELTLKVTAKDDETIVLDNAKLTFKVDGEDFTSGGNYTGTEVGTVSVTVASADADVYAGTAEATLTIVNPLPEATLPNDPTDDADDVDAIMSHFYGKAVKDNNPAWGGGPNPLWSSYEEIEVETDKKVWKVTGTGISDRPDKQPAAGDYQYVNVSVFPNSATQIKVYQDNGYGNAVTAAVTPRQWNYVTLPFNPTTNYYAIELVGENSFYMDNFYLSKLPAGTTGISAVELSEQYATTNVALPLTITVKGTKDGEEVTIANSDIDFTVTPATATLTATADGYTFKATEKGTYTIEAAPKATAEKMTGTATATIVVSDVVTLGTLTVEPATVASMTETTLTFTVKDSDGEAIDKALVDIALTEADKSKGTYDAETGKFTASIVQGEVNFVVTPKTGVSSVKTASAAVTAKVTVTKQELKISEKDEKGIVTVTGGVVTAEDLAKIEAIDALAIDLSGAAFDASIKKITPKNVNAMLIVAGEIETGGTTATSTAAEQLAETSNLIVKRGDGYYFPYKQLEITDGQPVWTDFFVSGNDKGWKYTRTIAANAVELALLPAVAALPEGLVAYTISSNSAEKMQLTKGAIVAHEPVVLYNTTNAPITLTITGNGDFDVRTTADRSLQKEIETGAKLIGTYTGLTAPEGAKTLTLKDGEPVVTDLTGDVAAFHAYLTLTTVPADVLAEGLTEIQEIKRIVLTGKAIIGQGETTTMKVMDAAETPKEVDLGKVTLTVTPAAAGTIAIANGVATFTSSKTYEGEAVITAAVKEGAKRVTIGEEAVTVKVTVAKEVPAQVLGGLKLETEAGAKLVAGAVLKLTVNVTDTAQAVIPADSVTVTVAPAADCTLTREGNVLTFTPNKAGTYTFTVAPATGVTKVVAGKEAVTAQLTIKEEMKIATIPTVEADSIFAPIYIYNGQETTNKTAGWITDYNGKATKGDEIEKDGRVAMPFYDTKCVFFFNSTIGDWAEDINPSERQYGKLHLDIYSQAAAEGKIAFEQTTAIGNEHPFTLKAGAWTSVEIDLDGETKLHTMSVRMDSVDIALANIYFTKAPENPDSLKVTDIIIGNPFVAQGVATDLQIVAKNNKGVTIDAANVTYSVKETGKGSFDENGRFTATATGTITIVATTVVDGKAYTAEATVTVLVAPEAPKTDDVFASLYPAQEGTATAFVGDWENKSQPQAEVTLGSQKVKPITSLGTVFINNSVVTSLVNQTFNPMEKQYGKIHVELYSAVEAKGTLSLKEAADVAFTLPAGKWTTIEYDLDSAAVSKVGNITIGMEKIGDTYPDVVLANMYFTKAAENPDSSIVAAITLGKTLIAKNTATDLEIVVTNNKGVKLDKSLYTLTADKGTFDDNGLFTATADGPITITATSTVNKEKTATATVNTLPSPATAPTDDKANVLAVYSDTYGVTAYTPSETGWNNGYGSQEELTLAQGDKAISVRQAGTFGLKLADVDLTSYYKLCAAVYSTENYEGQVQIEGANMTMNISLKAGQWNYLTLPLTGTRTNATWLNFTTGGKESTNNILIDNVYFAKLGANEMIIGDPDAQQVTAVVGNVTRANVSQLEAIDALAIDLTGATVAADIINLRLKNANAMVIVSGKVEGTEVTQSAMANQLSGIQNVLVRRDDGYYFPARTLRIVDGQPVWTGFLISGNSKGWSYTRTIAAGEMTTAYLPANPSSPLPNGVAVYKYDGRDDAGLHFSEAELVEKQPRVIHNQTGQAVTITMTGNGDLDLRPVKNDVDATGMVFVGTLSGVTKPAGRNIYTVVPASSGTRAGTTAGVKLITSELPFRAYLLADFTLNTSTAVSLGETSTGINGVRDNVPGNGAIYNMNGVRVDDVDNLRPGIYIRDGKKFVVK